MTNQQTRNGSFVVAEIHNAPQNRMITRKWLVSRRWVRVHP